MIFNEAKTQRRAGTKNPSMRSSIGGGARHLLIPVAALVLGCLPTIRLPELVPSGVDLERKHSQVVFVTAEGYKPHWSASVTGVDATLLRDAVTRAIDDSGVFHTSAAAVDADYELNVEILEIRQVGRPANILTGITIQVTATWTLMTPDRAVARFTIDEGYHGRPNASGRWALNAHEIAIRKNIHEGIRRLSQLDLRMP